MDNLWIIYSIGFINRKNGNIFTDNEIYDIFDNVILWIISRDSINPWSMIRDYW